MELVQLSIDSLTGGTVTPREIMGRQQLRSSNVPRPPPIRNMPPMRQQTFSPSRMGPEPTRKDMDLYYSKYGQTGCPDNRGPRKGSFMKDVCGKMKPGFIALIVLLIICCCLSLIVPMVSYWWLKKEEKKKEEDEN